LLCIIPQMRLLQLVFALCLLIRPPEVTAEPLPGAEDPALVTGAEQWLQNEDRADALRAIGALAAEGNLAAQHLWRRTRYLPG